MTTLEDLFKLLDARWTELGVDAIVVLVNVTPPVPMGQQALLDIDATETSPPEHVKVVPLSAGSVYRVDLHSIVHKTKPEHAESRKHRVGRHIKHVYFTEGDLADLSAVFARLEKASKLFDDMHAQRPDPAHHETVDAHPSLSNVVVASLPDTWALVLGRPL